MSKIIRRVVSGLNENGHSAVIFDGAAPRQFEVPGVPGQSAAYLWKTDTMPVDNGGVQDATIEPFLFPPPVNGSAFYIFEYPPLSSFDNASPELRARALRGGQGGDAAGSVSPHPGMHKTNTMEYIVMIAGEITIILEAGEVTLQAGDVFVDRGVFHAWENRGLAPAIFASIAIDAKPL